MEYPEKYHLSVGTEVSAKYRGAFCEAKIKSVKKNVVFRVALKKDNKSYCVAEGAIKGSLKLGSTVEAQFPEQPGWQEGVIQSARDKSIYTVEFDDGDVRTLSRGSLCLQGVRHYAESETLDHLPLTDPENFGTPVLNGKRKPKRKTPQSSAVVDEIEGQNTPEREPPAKRKLQTAKSETKDEDENIDCDGMRSKWLADPLMGKLVLVEPTDKRKHWFPAVVVNPMCFENLREVKENHVVVRSFKTGKIARVNRCEILTRNNAPSKVEPAWKDILEDAFQWAESGAVPDVWKADIKDIIYKDGNVEKEEIRSEEEKDFLKQLYKFMEDQGSPMNKTPVLGYKDLNLYLLYNLVQEKGGFHSVTLSTDWRDIYGELGIPKLTQAAGHHAKNAYIKYLLNFEQYIISFNQRLKPKDDNSSSNSKGELVRLKKLKSGRISPLIKDDDEGNLRRTTRRRKVSECSSVGDPEVVKRGRRSRNDEAKRDSDGDDASSTTGSEKSINRGRCVNEAGTKAKDRTRSNSGTLTRRKNVIYKIGDKLKVKYGKDSFKLYNAKVMNVEYTEGQEVQYYVHYAGWNSRHDEWIKSWQISACVNHTSPSSTQSPNSTSAKRPKTPVSLEGNAVNSNFQTLHSAISENVQAISQQLNFSSPSEVDTSQNNTGQWMKDDCRKSVTRRRSTSSSTPPPPTSQSVASEKRAASEEKVISTGNNPTKSTQSTEQNEIKSNRGASGRLSPLTSGLFSSNRRISARRSKSPAYLRESTLYGLSKRTRTSSIASASEDLPNENLSVNADMEDSNSDASRSTRSSPSIEHQPAQSNTWVEDPTENSIKLEKKKSVRKSDESKEKLSDIMEEKYAVVNIENQEFHSDSETKPCVCEKEALNRLTDKNIAKQKMDKGCLYSNPLNKNESILKEKNDDLTSHLPEVAHSSNSTSVIAHYIEQPTLQQPPSSSKVLVENTPPTTPEASPEHFYEEQLESDNVTNAGSGSSSLSGVEVNLSSSPECKEEKPSEDQSTHKRKKMGQSRRNSCSVNRGESDSDEDGGGKYGGNLSNSRRRVNKRKSKPKPAPPTAPPPVLCEELSKLTPEQRIVVLQAKLSEMRTVYQQLKQEVQSIDRKRKRAKRREQEASDSMLRKAPTSPIKRDRTDESTAAGESPIKGIELQPTFVLKI